VGGYSASEIISALMWLTLVLLPVLYTLVAFLDVARRPGWVWALAGKRQLLWLWLLGMSILTVYGGLLVATAYFIFVRPSLARTESGDLRKFRDNTRQRDGGDPNDRSAADDDGSEPGR